MNRRGRVLVVDDDENQRLAIEGILGLEHDVVAAGGVQDALHQLSRGRFDVVVTDYEMPDGTGQSLIEAVEKRGLTSTSAILLTGHSDYKAVRELQRSARALVLFKPVNPKELMAWVMNGVTMARLNAATASNLKNTPPPPPSSTKIKRPLEGSP
jgi:DNA-binding NtrC family response regulator